MRRVGAGAARLHLTGLDDIRALLTPLGDAWLVGGCLRDAALGAPLTDVDVAVAGDAAEPARRLARDTGATRFRLSGAFGSWRLHGGRLPVDVDVTPLQGPLHEDLGRRDFAINAMAMAIAGDGALIDPHGGMADAAARRLRAVSDHALADDPVRVLRAARLSQQHGLTADPATVALCRAAAPRLWDAPGERLRAEIAAMSRLRHPDRAFAALDGLGGLDVLVPQLGEARGMDQNPYHHKDVLGHTLEVVQHGADIAADPVAVFGAAGPGIAAALGEPVGDGLRRREVAMLACLLHDMAKPATRDHTPDGRVTFMRHDVVGAGMAASLLDALRFSHRVRDAVAACVREHLVIGFLVHRQPLSLRQVYRAVTRLEPVVAESFVLSVADRLATDGPKTNDTQIRRHLVLARDLARTASSLPQLVAAPPVLRGDEIAEAVGVPAGPWLTQAVAALREQQVVRPGMSRAYALRFVQEWAAKSVVR